MILSKRLPKERLEELKEDGHTFSQIAEMHNVSPSSITKLARKYGVKAKTSGQHRCSSSKISEEKLKELYYENKLSIKDIAIMYGIGNASVHRLFEVYNLPKRTRTESARLNKSQNLNADINFFREDSAEKFYVVGLIASDGFVKGNAVSFTSKDRDLVEYYVKMVGCTNEIKENTHQVKDGITHSYTARFSSVEAVSILENYGITERKSLTYTPRNIPKEYQSDFLRGVFDGDGSISVLRRKDTGAWSSKFSIVTASSDFAEYIKCALTDIGADVNKITKDRRGNGLYAVSVGKRSSIVKIAEWFYGDNLTKYGLSRKKEKMNKVIALTSRK